MPCYEIDGVRPVIDPGAYVHPTAVLIGDVVVADRCYVGPGASLRGDFGRIILRSGSNIQDNCTMHSFPGRAAVIDVDGHVGHGAVLHGCHVGRNALVGMNAVVMDDVVVGEGCIIGAMSFVKAGTVLPDRSLWAGVPARLIREVTEQELAWKAQGTSEYHTLTMRSLASLKPCEPLVVEEPDRPLLPGDYVPLSALKAK